MKQEKKNNKTKMKIHVKVEKYARKKVIKAVKSIILTAVKSLKQATEKSFMLILAVTKICGRFERVTPAGS